LMAFLYSKISDSFAALEFENDLRAFATPTSVLSLGDCVEERIHLWDLMAHRLATIHKMWKYKHFHRFTR
jgi:hypothetical protein